MARTDTLTNYLTDVATAIKTKKGDNTPIKASEFDTEIANLPSGGGAVIEITDASYLFYEGARTEYLNEILSLCKNVTSAKYMFYMCKLSELDLSNFDTSEIEDASYMFSNNMTVQKYDLTGWDTSKVKKMTRMFYSNTNITDLVMLDASSVQNISGVCDSCIDLTNFGGFMNLGKGFATTAGENSSSLKLNLSSSNQLTEQSLINVLNGLYDIASIGVKTQTCQLGSTNLAKLTSEAGQQALANATAKGWSVS